MTAPRLAHASLLVAVSALVALAAASCSSSSSSDAGDAGGACTEKKSYNFSAPDADPDVQTHEPDACFGPCAAADPGFASQTNCCHGYGYGCSYLGGLVCVFACHEVPDAPSD